MRQILHTLHEFVWSPGMLALFLFTGAYFTVRSNFFPILGFKEWFGQTLGSLFKNSKTRKTKETQAVSQFQSFCTALAATLGTGNITGVATAMMAGGPGSIFWMWISAVLGMMTNYAENYLGITYRYKDENGQWVGGAMVYIEKGLGCKWLAVFFSFCCIGASFGMGNMVQGNSMANGLKNVFHVPTFFTAIVSAVVIAYVLNGGMKRIASCTEKLVPLMAGIYLVTACGILIVCRHRVEWAFGEIMKNAFTPRAACAGVGGYQLKTIIQTGISRGVFSNEAGLGSSVIAHVQSDVKKPEVQGMWGIAEIFVDTILVCTVTALALLVSGVYHPEICIQNLAAGIENIDGTTLMARAFGSVIPFGEELLALSTVLFALATMIGWSCLGERTAVYLGKEKAAKIYKWFYVAVAFTGCMLAPALIWELSDTLNGLMAIPNLLTLFLLRKEVQYPEKLEKK